MNYSFFPRRSAALLGLLAYWCAVGQAPAQVTNVPWAGAGDEAAWEVADNWNHPDPDMNFVPDKEFDEVAVVNGGALAVITDAQTPLGVSIGGNGDVEIRTGGALATDPDEIVFPESAVITVNGSLNVVGGSATTNALTVGGTLSFAGNGAVTVANESALNGALTLNGPSAAFATGSLALGGGHSYTQALTSAAASTVSVTGEAALGGSLTLDFSGTTAPSVGDTYDLISAGSVAGSFNSVSAIEPGPGRQVVVNNVANTVQAEVIAGLALHVDRDAGTMMITNPTSGSVVFDSYQIASAIGSMNAAGLAGLTSQSVPGWEEANPNANSIGELNAQSSTAAGGGFGLGAIYDPNLSTFGIDYEDHVFTYRTEDGNVFQGQVEYVGTKIQNDFVLLVDPATGNGELFNDSATPLPIDAYQVQSDAGSLDSAGFTGLGGAWINSNPSANTLTDLNPEGHQTIAPFATIALGKIFNPGESQDVAFQYFFADVGGGEGDNADFDGNNQVDGADMAIWQQSYLTDAGGDANGDGETNAADLAIWNSQFGGAPSGGGPTAPGNPDVLQTGVVIYQSLGGGAAGVPEPSTFALIGCAAIGWIASRRRRAVC